MSRATCARASVLLALGCALQLPGPPIDAAYATTDPGNYTLLACAPSGCSCQTAALGKIKGVMEDGSGPSTCSDVNITSEAVCVGSCSE